MVERRWPACISDENGKPRIRITHKGIRVFDETLSVNINSKSGIAHAIRIRDGIKNRLALGLSAYVKGDSQHHLFNEAAQNYINQFTGALSTHLDYESILNSWWLPEFGNTITEEISTKDIRRVLNSRKVTTKRKRNALIPLRGVFDYLDINPNPASFKIKNTDQKSAVERYRPEERSALLSALNGEDLLYFALLLGCGFRPSGEVLALKWKDYDGHQIHVHKTISRRQLKPSTKTYVERKVVVPNWVKPIIENHPTRFKDSFIFLNSKGSFFKDSDHFNAAWKAVHKLTDIPYRIPYTCRHTRAAELLSIGIEPAEAADQLGHSLQMFMQIYSEFISEYCKDKDPSRFNGLAPELKKVPRNCREAEVVPIRY